MTVGSLLQGALALLKARPGSVAVWGVVNLALTIGTAYGTMWVIDAQIMSGADVPSAIGNLLLVYLCVAMIAAVLYTAALRAALRPGEDQLASLRLGMDEVRQFLLALLYLIGFVVLLFFLSFALAVFGGVAAVVEGGPGATAWLVYIPIFATMAWFYTKVSLSFPLTLMQRRFVVGEAWSLTRGSFWTLLGAYALIFAIVFVLSLLAGFATEPDYLSTFVHGANSPEAQAAVLRDYQLLRYEGPDAMMIAGWVLTAVTGTIGLTLWAGAAATAARELSGDMDGLTETFS
jgi:hypothetical protein